MKTLITQLIKIVSPIAMIGAISLELEMVYFSLNHWQMPNFLTILVIVGSIALVIHAIEAIIAAFLARNKGYNPLKYGIYTFFVGTVGLFELFTQK